MLQSYLNQVMTKISVHRNVYGDITADGGSSTQVGCRFRVITNTTNSSSHEEVHSEEAMAWFAPNSGIVRGDILLYEGQTWKVQKVNEARRLGETDIQFLKCWLQAYGLVS